jgi:hypothetical protein
MPEKFQFSFITSAAVFEIDRGARCLGTTGQVMVPRALRKIKMAHKVTLRFTRIRQRVIQSHEESVQRHYCQSCQREVEMLTEAQAERLLEVDDRMLSHLIAKEKVHAIILVSGIRRICRESLIARQPAALQLGGT